MIAGISYTLRPQDTQSFHFLIRFSESKVTQLSLKQL